MALSWDSYPGPSYAVASNIENSLITGNQVNSIW